MDFFRRFTVLIAAPVFDADNLEGHRLDEISRAIEKLGFQVVRARRIEDGEIAVQTDTSRDLRFKTGSRRAAGRIGPQGRVDRSHLAATAATTVAVGTLLSAPPLDLPWPTIEAAPTRGQRSLSFPSAGLALFDFSM